MHTLPDLTLSRPELRRVWREERNRLRRKARRARIAAKCRFLAYA